MVSLPSMKGLDLHVGDRSLSFAAVYLTDDQILGYVYQTSGQVTGVGCTQSRIGQTLRAPCAEMKYSSTSRPSRKLDLMELNGMTGSIGHKSAHASKLFDLLIGSTRSGVSHHEDVVVFIKSS